MKSARKDIKEIKDGITIDSQKEQCLIRLSSEELENIQIYKHDTVLLYRLDQHNTESSDETVYEWCAYDLEQNKNISLKFSKDSNLHSFNVLGDWIYYSEENNNRWTLYRKNRFTDQTNKIKEVSNADKILDTGICNDQLLILYEDENFNIENLEFVDLSAL